MTAEPKGSKVRRNKGEKCDKKKMATAFTVYTINPEAECAPDPIACNVYAFLSPQREPFKAFVCEAANRGYGRLKTLFLSDGDRDLNRRRAEYFSEAEPCVD